MRRLLFATALISATMLGGAPGHAADGQDRRVRINNQTSETLVHFHASQSGRAGWEGDILGNNVIAAGASDIVNLEEGDGACLYDFLSIFESGKRAESRAIDVCTTTDYTVR